MITTLHIKNIGIIDEVTINLEEGFNVLTGETGAGKTLIVDSLNIICGSRFSKEMIRRGENYSLVEICMFLPHSNISEDGNVIVTREIYDSGKNLCKINGRLVTVSELKEFMKNHLDIHGQFDNQFIMDEANHINYLDSFAKEKISTLKEEYSAYYSEYLDLNRKLKENYGDEKERERTLDLLRYELNEIENANLIENEEEELKEKYDVVKNSEKILEALNKSSSILDQSVLADLDEVIKNISRISNLKENYNKLYSNIQDAYYLLEDVNSEMQNEIGSLDFDSNEAEMILKRMDLICNLKRKYGSSITEIIKYSERIKDKLNQIENSKQIIEDIEKRLKIVEDNMYSLSIKMNKIRNEFKDSLCDRINNNFKELEMNQAEIKVEIEMDEKGRFSENGLDKVRFLICTNKGEEFKSLTKIASGGEISRVILAIKSILSEEDKVESCVFDEIDTGISGSAARVVGEKIKEIAKNHQVICITHLPQVAAFSNAHFYISKVNMGERVVTKIKLLNNEEKVEEIARISSGKVNETTLKFALELINLSSKPCVA